VYRRAIAAADPEFRDQYESDMVAALDRMLKDERRRAGWLGAARLWLRAMADARRTARRERSRPRPLWLAGAADDVKFVWRSWRRTPSFAATAILTIALGTGLNAAIFAVADGILFRALPFPQPEDLYQVRSAQARRGFPWGMDMLEARDRHPDLIGIVGWRTSNRAGGNVRVDGNWLRPLTYEVSPGFSATLGVWPALGRTFSAADHMPNAPLVALISQAFWRQAFGGDPSAIGRRINMPRTSGDLTIEIVGVLPPWFRSLDVVNDAPDMLVPGPDDAWQAATANGRPNLVDVVVRVRPGRPLPEVLDKLNAIVAGLSAVRPETEPDRSVRLVP